MLTAEEIARAERELGLAAGDSAGVSALVLDAGALLAVDRGERAMMARLRVAQQSGLELRSNAMVVAQRRCTNIRADYTHVGR